MRYILLIIMMLVCGNAHANEYYIGKYQWNESEQYWGLPSESEAISALDLRSIAKQATKGGEGGFGIFIYKNLITDSSLRHIGSSLNEDIPQAKIDAINTRLGTNIQNLTVGQFIKHFLTDGTRNKRIVPNKKLNYEVKFGNETLEWKHNNTNRLALFAQMKEDFRELYNENPTLARKMLSIWKEKYRITDEKNFLPSDLQDVTALPHETTHTESFNCSNQDLGDTDCDLDWTDMVGDWNIVSNQMSSNYVGTPMGGARAEVDVSDNDHYVQALSVELGSDNASYQGIFARLSSSAFTGYIVRINGNGNTVEFRKIVSGSQSFIQTATAHTYADGETYKLTVDGSSLTFEIDDVEIMTATDTGITTGTRGGLGGRRSSALGDRPNIWDDFTISDLVAETPTGTSTKFFN